MSLDDAPRPDKAAAIAEFLAELPPDSAVLAPIDEIIDMVAHERELPAVAIGACLLRFDEAAPKLRAVLERAANGERDGDEEGLLFRAIHILGGGRDPQSCRPLLRLLRRPADEVEYLLGEAQTATLPRIVAGMFDGDVDALFRAIADTDIDEFVRWSLLGAATFLTWDGRIDRDRFIRFLEDFDGRRLADPQDAAWCGWEDAIALLGPRDLVSLVERAWADGRMEPENVAPEFFYADLARAEAAPDDIARLADQGLGYIADVLETLQMFPDASDDDADDEELLEWAARDFMPSEPYVNPMRHVGRNDPCPCGSGKKAKKCCLAT